MRRIERVERALIVTKRTRDPERTRDHPARDRRKHTNRKYQFFSQPVLYDSDMSKRSPGNFRGVRFLYNTCRIGYVATCTSRKCAVIQLSLKCTHLQLALDKK